MPEVIGIYLRPGRGSISSASAAKAVQGLGLEGDHFAKKGGLRQVTILSKKVWDNVCAQLGTKLHPSIRRANILVDDIDLKDSVGKQLKIGDVEISIEGETTPCKLMDDAFPGLKDALKPGWSGGVYGKVLNSGRIRLGQQVSFL